MQLDGKVVMVTGASSGIGEATARVFASRGATVVITSEKAHELQTVADSIIDSGGKAVPIVVDFSKPDQTSGLIRKAEEHCGPIDVLVNNAGIGMHALVTERPVSDLRFLFEINFMASATLSSEILPGMLQRGSGRIINISSAAGQFGCANFSAYSASKGALHAYTQALRVEALSHNVFVSEVIPISVKTPFFENSHGRKYRPLGVVLTVESVAECIVKCAAAERPAPEVWPYRWIRLVFLLNALAPGLLVKFNSHTFIRNRRELGLDTRADHAGNAQTAD